jgi:hypothetical protein
LARSCRIFWEYHNNLIREFVVYSLGIIDDTLRLQGKETVGEQWADKMGIDLFYEREDPATGQKYMQSRKIGKTTPVKISPSYLKSVK